MIFSGEIGIFLFEDNVYIVVFMENVSLNMVVDGFIIIGGIVNVEQDGLSWVKEFCGVGWYNLVNGVYFFLVICNCKFVDNKVCEGVGMYNFVINGGECSLIIEKF